MKRSSLNRKPRKRTPADPHWNAARGSVCVGCSGVCGKLQQHHIVYEQEVKRRGGAIWDVRNALTLGAHCHAQHHSHAQPIPLVYLPDRALEFAFELMGPAAFDYLGRRYSGDDSRLFDPDGNPWPIERVYARKEEAPASREGATGGVTQEKHPPMQSPPYLNG